MDIIKHGETGFLVDPEAPADIAAAVVNLLKNPGKMGERAAECINAEGEPDFSPLNEL